MQFDEAETVNPPELPREVVEYESSESEKICASSCQKAWIGAELSEQLEIIPVMALTGEIFAKNCYGD